MTFLPMPEGEENPERPWTYLPDPLGRIGRGRWEQRRRRDPMGRLQPDASLEGIRESWRNGATLAEMFGADPFALDGRVARDGDNHRSDVAKVQTLLDRTGHEDLASTEGPTGLYSWLLDEAIKRFQTDERLEVDGIVNPDGESIRRLAAKLKDQTGDADETGQPGGRIVQSNPVGTFVRALPLLTRVAPGAIPSIDEAAARRRKAEQEALRRVGPKRSVPHDTGVRIPPFPGQPIDPRKTAIPGTPSEPPFDPKEAGAEIFPADPPRVVHGTTFPITAEAKPQILIFPDLSDEIEQIVIQESRKGNADTRVEVLATIQWWQERFPELKLVGGGKEKEYWLPGPGHAWKDEKGHHGDGRPGGKWLDIAFERPDGTIIGIQLADVDKNGKPTQRELDNAEAIRRQRVEGRHVDVWLIPKKWQLKRLRGE